MTHNYTDKIFYHFLWIKGDTVFTAYRAPSVTLFSGEVAEHFVPGESWVPTAAASKRRSAPLVHLCHIILFAFSLLGCSASNHESQKKSPAIDAASKHITAENLGFEKDLQDLSFEFSADQLGALQLTSCLQTEDLDSCPRYPNPQNCKSLDVTISQEATISANCRIDSLDLRLTGTADGIPLACGISEDKSCRRCIDTFGNPLVDECEGSAITIEYIFDYSGAEGGEAHTTTPRRDEPTGDRGPTPQNCTEEEVLQLFARKMNEVLANEGLDQDYKPLLPENRNAAYISSGAVVSAVTNTDGLPVLDVIHAPTLLSGKFCYAAGELRACRCARMAHEAFRRSVRGVGAKCPIKNWMSTLWVEAGLSTTFLATDTYTSAMRSSMDGSATRKRGFACIASPLVLDLDGSGMQISSVEEGVKFDLFGQGKEVKTAWVKGNNALLVIDRNHNGRIDSGNELFGEGMNLDNQFSTDGFSALELLDTMKYGGNRDARFDEHDAYFNRVQLWIDGNRDAIAQPGELRSLKDAGVKSISLSPTFDPLAIDKNFNHLGYKSSFEFTNGIRGQIVDVFFNFRTLD
jgi:hypothetical protein